MTTPPWGGRAQLESVDYGTAVPVQHFFISGQHKTHPAVLKECILNRN